MKPHSVKYIAALKKVNELALVGSADLSWWRDFLASEDIEPVDVDGKAQVLVTGLVSRWMGIPFIDLSVIVAAQGRSGLAERGYYLARGINTSRFLAGVERRCLRLPYRYRGDLHVVIQVQEHKLFKRNNDNLVLQMPVSFAQAALGAKVSIPTLDGEQEITIKSGTQHGETFRVRGAGLPDLRSGRRGELIVLLMIEVPTKLTKDQEKLLRQYADTEDHRVLPHNKSFWKKIKDYLST